VGRLYVPAGRFYGYRGELARGGGSYGPGRERGRLNGRGGELYGLIGRLGGFSGWE